VKNPGCEIKKKCVLSFSDSWVHHKGKTNQVRGIPKQLIVGVVFFLLVMTIPTVTVSNNSFLCSTLWLLLLM